MRYLMLIHPAADGAVWPAEGCEISDWLAYNKDLHDAGVWVSGEQIADFVTATTVQVTASGARSVTDGPFAESREMFGGFYVIDVPDLDAAIDWAARCPGALGGAAITIRPIAQVDVAQPA